MADGALAPGMLATTVELYRLFALDESEKVHVAVADVLASGFGAEAAVFLYRDGRREFRLCLNGKDSPIHALKAHWEEIAVRSPKVQGVSKFGPWGIPGMINPLDHWMSVQLNSKKRNIGYLLIGRFKVPWENDDTLALESIAHSIEPIIDARIEREREAFIRSHVDFIPSKSERRFQAFFEDTRDMVYTANSEDIMTTVNQAGLTLTGRTEKHELLGHPFSSLALNSADREFFLHRIFLEGNVADYEIVLVKKDGNTAFCLETAHALRGQSGEIVEVQGIIKDISERIRHEGELWKTNLELAEANLKLKQAQVSMVSREKMASIGQLSAGIAHEINNPVGFLKSNMLMLEKYTSRLGEAWEEARVAARPAIEEIENRLDLGFVFKEFEDLFSESAEGFSRIIRIIGNLKNFSRIDMTEEFEVYNVNKGIESTLIVAENEIKYVADTRIELGDLPDIRARGGEINQVILNLLVNAAQAIASQNLTEKGVIGVGTRTLGENVQITIHDTGPGIPESIRTRIFDPFFTTKEPGKGTGLGLSISYDIIVTKHQGSIVVESEPGEGTTFIIELPIAGPH